MKEFLVEVLQPCKHLQAMKTNNYYLYGYGGHAKVLWDAAKASNVPIKGCYASNLEQAYTINEIPFLGLLDPTTLSDNFYMNIAIGNNQRRQKIAQQIGGNYFNITHPSSVQSSYTTLGIGNSFLANSVVHMHTKIGNHCIINTGAVVEHDCVLNNFVHIAPNATLCGNVTVGEGTLIGAGAVVVPGIKIGKWVTVGAGAVIVNNIPDHAVVVGNPGKIIRTNNE